MSMYGVEIQELIVPELANWLAISSSKNINVSVQCWVVQGDHSVCYHSSPPTYTERNFIVQAILLKYLQSYYRRVQTLNIEESA